MKYPDNPSYSDEDYEGCVTAGRATGRPIPPPSDEDLRRAEEAWNDPRAYHLAMEESFYPAGYVPPRVDPNRSLVPSETEIEKLPRWARVAFAARCARRVQPLVKYFWRDAPEYHLKAVDVAVRLAEESATSAVDIARVAVVAAQAALDSARSRLDKARTAFHAIDAEAGRTFAAIHRSYPLANPRTDSVYSEAREINARVDNARELLYAAERDFQTAARDADGDAHGGVVVHHATSIAAVAADAARSARAAPALGSVAAANAAMSAVMSLCQVVTISTINSLTVLASDFDRLRRLAQWEKWTDDTPVPPTVFGPMWEGTPPSWWADHSSAQ